MKIQNCKKNCLGTICFDGKFSGMRKAQEFIVYPLEDSGTKVTIQSKTRIGTIDLANGQVIMSQSHPNGAYFLHLALDKKSLDALDKEDCQTLAGWINATGGTKVGNGIVYCDNTGAIGLKV